MIINPDLSTKYDCPICMVEETQNLTDPEGHFVVLLGSGHPSFNHTFHKACISNWVNQNGTCPRCTRSVSIGIPASSFTTAVHIKNLSEVKQILEDKAEPDSSIETIVQMTAVQGQKEIVSEILKARPDFLFKTILALFDAHKQEYAVELMKEVCSKAKISSADRNSLLVRAAKEGVAYMVEFLLKDEENPISEIAIVEAILESKNEEMRKILMASPKLSHNLREVFRIGLGIQKSEKMKPFPSMSASKILDALAEGKFEYAIEIFKKDYTSDCDCGFLLYDVVHRGYANFMNFLLSSEGLHNPESKIVELFLERDMPWAWKYQKEIMQLLVKRLELSVDLLNGLLLVASIRDRRNVVSILLKSTAIDEDYFQLSLEYAYRWEEKSSLGVLLQDPRVDESSRANLFNGLFADESPVWTNLGEMVALFIENSLITRETIEQTFFTLVKKDNMMKAYYLMPHSERCHAEALMIAIQQGNMLMTAMIAENTTARAREQALIRASQMGFGVAVVLLLGNYQFSSQVRGQAIDAALQTFSLGNNNLDQLVRIITLIKASGPLPMEVRLRLALKFPCVRFALRMRELADWSLAHRQVVALTGVTTMALVIGAYLKFGEEI